jgi:hypothetical protein
MESGECRIKGTMPFVQALCHSGAGAFPLSAHPDRYRLFSALPCISLENRHTLAELLRRPHLARQAHFLFVGQHDYGMIVTGTLSI